MKKLLSTTGRYGGQICSGTASEGVRTGRIDGRSGLPRVLRDLRLVLREPGGTIDGRVGAAHVSSANNPFDRQREGTYIEISYEAVLAGLWPLTNRFHASLHSCTTSTAYFFPLASPLNAKTFYPRRISTTFGSRKVRDGSPRAFHRGFCRFGTTLPWPSSTPASASRHPRYRSIGSPGGR
jgi:hypothetical protein